LLRGRTKPFTYLRPENVRSVSVLPKVIESLRAELRASHGVLNVRMAQVVLDCTSVMAVIGQLVAAGMP
jgi:hypothetical protein